MLNPVRTVALEGAVVLLPGGNRLEAVDESRHQTELRHLCGEPGTEAADIPVRVVLVHEADNSNDPEAVQLVISGHPVGYLDPYDGKRLAPLLDALAGDHDLLAGCRGRIVGGYAQPVVATAGRERGQRHFDYQLELDLAPVDELRDFLAGPVSGLETFDPAAVTITPRHSGESEAAPATGNKAKSGCLTIAALVLATLAVTAWAASLL